MVATDFATAVDRLINQTAHWEQPRWAAPADETTLKADLVFALLQHLADADATAEGLPRRGVPRVGDLVLPDQLRVLADDLIAAGSPDQLAEATLRVTRTRLQL